LLDQLLLLVADPEPAVFADLRHTISAGDAEDHVKLLVRPADGPTLDIESSTAAALAQDTWYVIGTAGAISGSSRERTVRRHDPPELPPLEADPGTPSRKYPAAPDFNWSEEIIQVDTTERRSEIFYTKLHDT